MIRIRTQLQEGSKHQDGPWLVALERNGRLLQIARGETRNDAIRSLLRSSYGLCWQAKRAEDEASYRARYGLVRPRWEI